MKYLKAHLFLIVCGVIVVAALLVNFLVFSGWHEQLQTEINARAGMLPRLGALMQGTMVIPGSTKDLARPITPNMTKAKQDAMDKIQKLTDACTKIVSKENRIHKIDEKGDPLLDGQPQTGLLPSINPAKGDAMSTLR